MTLLATTRSAHPRDSAPATGGHGRLWLGRHARSSHQLSVQFGLDDLRFTASYWYADADLVELESRWGPEVMARVYFHITAFTANALLSLRPERFDPGPYAAYCTTGFHDLWQQVFHGVWAQWRYQHDLPDYAGPRVEPTAGPPPQPVRGGSSTAKALAFVGGGKDSVASLRLLERSGLDCDSLVYSSSTYGSAEQQHALCDALLDSLGRTEGSRRRVWVFDDVSDSPLLRLGPTRGLHELTTAETPASVFATLPLVLAHGYTHLCLGHERSADRGNLLWSRTGEEVNHQWGKSSACESLLADYLRTELVEDCSYVSPLKPVHDPLILELLREDAECIPFTHSCNLRKPWCGRCPKCAYVWLSYQAYLPAEIVARTFVGFGNLLDLPENQTIFRQLLGLTDHTPFECIGSVDEVRLAFELCRRRGLRGEAMSVFETEVPPVDTAGLLARYRGVGDFAPTAPPDVRAAIRPLLERQSARSPAPG